MAALSLLGALTDIFPEWKWQLPALILLIAIIIGWVMYRRKQM